MLDKYNEALEKAKKLYEQGTITESLAYIFPELKESNDEKIRKKICKILWDNVPYEEAQRYINYICRKQTSTNSEEDEEMKETCIFYLNQQKCYVSDVSCIEKCITWLERQGAYANFCNKIQIGDKVTRNRDGVLVNLSQLKRVAKPSKKQGEQDNSNVKDYNSIDPYFGKPITD